MSSCDRRRLLAGLAALGVAPGCAFEPALRTAGGPLTPLYGQVAIAAPSSRMTFVMTQHLEERLGRAALGADFVLDYTLDLDTQSLGTDPGGTAQRVQIEGVARFDLRRRGAAEPLFEGRVAQFTGYSATGNTVSTNAAETDARARLARMLADGIVARLLVASPDLDL